MKKLLVALFLVAASSVISSAQEKLGNNFSFGGGYNIAFPNTNAGVGYRLYGPAAYFEYRYLEDISIDYGGNLSYRYAKGNGQSHLDAYMNNEKYHQIGLKGFADYNFCPDNTVCPYAGFSLGLGTIFINYPEASSVWRFHYISGVRAGVQIQRIRIQCDFDLLSSNFRMRSYTYSSGMRLFATELSFSIGVSF